MDIRPTPAVNYVRVSVETVRILKHLSSFLLKKYLVPTVLALPMMSHVILQVLTIPIVSNSSMKELPILGASK